MRARGFTLVEVLVALAVMALLAALAWPALDGVLRAREEGRASIDRTMRLLTVLAQFETDLRMLQMDDTLPAALAFDGRTLRLLRRTGPGLQLVAWSWEADGWLRWASPAVTTVGELQELWLRSQQLASATPPPLRMLEGIGDVQVFCYLGGSLSNCQSSRDLESLPGSPSAAASAASAASAAPARTSELLPSGVRLVLQVDGRSVTRDLAVASGL